MAELKSPELKFYNTLTRTKEVFQPIDDKNVRMYVCGPTVYDFAHIGNARPAIVFDVLFRLLRHVFGEDHVTYVRNITDLDDKINARALRDFGEKIAAGEMSLNEAIRHVTEKTATQYHADVKALGCLEPTFEPRATEFVLPRPDGKSDMVTLIQSLLDRKHAYIAKGSEGREVLFDVTSMENYGALSNRKLEDQQAGARIAVESHKKNPGDFVLWKESAADQPGWDGTFTADGKKVAIHGRPGWHIECSAMSDALLWDDVKDRLSPEGLAHPHRFDIHGGGLDLIFPHHENEIAQSCCAHNTGKMANLWMHNGYLQVEGKKMSKSDGNFVTIHDLLHTEKFGGRMWAGAVLRFAMLSRSYKEPLDFTNDGLLEAFADLAITSTAISNVNLRELDYPEDFRKRCWSEPFKPSSGVLEALSNDLDTRSALQDIMHRVKFLTPEKRYEALEIIHDLRFLGIVEERTLPLLSGSESSMQWGKAPIEKVNTALSLVRMKKIASANSNFGYVKTIDDKLASLGFVESEYSTGSFDVEYVGELDGDIDEKISQRLALLAEKNFAEADRIRDELLSQGIQLKDSKDSQTGERITTWEVKR